MFFLAHMIHNAILTRTLFDDVTFIMELEQLIQQRDAYGGKIVKLLIHIGLIFIVPILVIALVSYLTGITFMYLFPVAFIISWTGVILLYRKVSKEVRALDVRIKELREQETKPEETSYESSENK